MASRNDDITTIMGNIRGLSQYYNDGLERMEIWVDKKHAFSLPYRDDQRVPITLLIGERMYGAGIRSTLDNRYVWICPDLKIGDKTVKLAQALINNGFRKNQQVCLNINSDVISIIPTTIEDNVMKSDAIIIASYCKKVLNLEHTTLSDEYYYNCLPLCVIDAVFSMGINYSATRRVVDNFCDKLKVKKLRDNKKTYPQTRDQFSMESLLNVYKQHDFIGLAENLFSNRNRTSPRNGILKAEAVFHFSSVLVDFKINYFQDLLPLIGNHEFESCIKKIPGQKSGISTRYFYMLAGDENFIKPDRMIIRFIKYAVRETMTAAEASNLITSVYKILREEFPSLTLRALDHEIWKYTRDKQA